MTSRIMAGVQLRPQAPRMQVTKPLQVKLMAARARLVEAAEEAQRLARPDAMTARGFIKDAITEVDRAIDRLTQCPGR